MDYLYPLTTFSFAYPYLLAAPFLICVLAAVVKRKNPAPLYPRVSLLARSGSSLRLKLRPLVLIPLGGSFVFFLALAAARPQKPHRTEEPFDSHNIMLALDVSPSMGAADFPGGTRRVTRLRAVKSVVDQFVEKRRADRVGLAVFGGTAYLQAPLTLDHDLIRQLVNKLEVGMAGDGTAIGDALGLCLKRMAHLPAKSKSIILLTDGVSNAGQVNPIKAAKVAEDLGVKIHTIGIGTNEPIVVRLPGGIFSQQVQTEVVFDEKTLKQIAELTGGVYYNATTLEGLGQIYQQIDQLEKTRSAEPARRTAQELFAPYAAIALFLYLSYLALSNTFWMKVP